MSIQNRDVQKWLKLASLSLVLIFMIGLMSYPFAADVAKAEEPTEAAGPDRPNIVVFMADDMGYTDVGAFGGEIPTPNIDSLATNGMMMTNFHTMPSCSPTRAAFLTGVDDHLNGFGTMGSRIAPAQAGQLGYEAKLTDRVATVAEVLADNDYHTFVAGKWHMGEAPAYLPPSKGFEKSFILGPGAASHFPDQIGFSPGRPIADYWEDGEWVPTGTLPSDFYSSDFYTSKMISYTESITDGQPFFAYMAYTAPHGPLHVPTDDTYVQEILSDTMGMYNYQAGWEVLRQARFDRMKALGIISNTLDLPPRWTLDTAVLSPIPEWGDLTAEEQAYEAKRMAVYGAMIRHLDDHIGRFIQHLKDTGEYDNTIFVFFGDNGADDLDRTILSSYQNWFAATGIDNSIDNIGEPHSFIVLGTPWSQVSSTPFYAAKATVAEGGLRNSFLISYDGVISPTTRSDAFASIYDLTPTFLDFAGAAHPAGAAVEMPNWDNCTHEYNDRTICPMNGRSLRDLLTGTVDDIYEADDYVGFELYGEMNKALYSGDGWKILRMGQDPWGDDPANPTHYYYRDQSWKLFNLNEDPRELAESDLSQDNPQKLQEMIALYNEYERNVGFISADALMGNVTSGSVATYTLEISNTTGMDETFTLACNSDWSCTLEDASISLAAGELGQVSVMVSAPADAQDGESNNTQVTVNATNNPQASSAFTLMTTVDNTPTAVTLTTFSSGEPTNLPLYGAALMLTMMAGLALWRRRKSESRTSC